MLEWREVERGPFRRVFGLARQLFENLRANAIVSHQRIDLFIAYIEAAELIQRELIACAKTKNLAMK